MLLYSSKPSPFYQTADCLYVMYPFHDKKEMTQRTSWPISMRATFSSSPL